MNGDDEDGLEYRFGDGVDEWGRWVGVEWVGEVEGPAWLGVLEKEVAWVIWMDAMILSVVVLVVRIYVVKFFLLFHVGILFTVLTKTILDLCWN